MSNDKANGLGGPLELWPVNQTIPYENNPKTHPPEQIEKLARAIDCHGFTQPIVVDENGVILVGHGRRLAALYLNLEQVPVVVRTGLSETEKQAIRISDNTLAALGDIDEDALTEELKKMMRADDDFNIGLDDLGLVDFDISKLSDNLDDQPSTSLEDQSSTDDKTAEEHDYTQPDLSKEKEYKELYQIIVDCSGEADQQKVYELLTSQGWTCRPLTI